MFEGAVLSNLTGCFSMRIAGIVLLVVAFLSFFMPYSGAAPFLFAICMTGGAILVVAGPLLQVKRGPLIIGKVLEVKQSMLGTKLTVQFKTVDGQQVSASGRTTLSHESVLLGMPIPLRYNPKNPKKILIEIEDSEDMDQAFTAYHEKRGNGVLAFGVLVSEKNTGVQLENGHLMELTLRFSTVEKQQVVASGQSVVLNLENLQPGTIFPLRYDPEDPEQIMVGLGSKEEDEATVLRAIRTYFFVNGISTQEEEDMKERGVKANGVIVSVQPSGNTVNGHEEMVLQVKVTRPDNGGIYDATVKKPIPSDALASVQPGRVVGVYYMPEDEKSIVIDNVINLRYAL